MTHISCFINNHHKLDNNYTEDHNNNEHDNDNEYENEDEDEDEGDEGWAMRVGQQGQRLKMQMHLKPQVHSFFQYFLSTLLIFLQ